MQLRTQAVFAKHKLLGKALSMDFYPLKFAFVDENKSHVDALMTPRA